MAGIPKAEQSEKTQRALLDAAQGLFAERGYARTSTEEIVQRAAVTRGALYYHYHDKAGLFKAVYDEQRAALVRAVGERIQAAEGDMWQRMVVEARHAFLEQATNPDVQRILYIDGPAVLDWEVIKGPEPALRLIGQVFEQLMDEGLIDRMPIDPLAYMFWSIGFQAGIYIAQADDSAAAQAEMTGILDRVVSGLRSASRKPEKS